MNNYAIFIACLKDHVRYLKLKLLPKLTQKRGAGTIVEYTRAATIIHRDFIAYKLPLPRHALFHGIYLQRKKQQLIDSDGNGRFSPTDPESHDMRRVIVAAKTNRITFLTLFFFTSPSSPVREISIRFYSELSP